MNRLLSWKWLLSNSETTIWDSAGLSFTGLVSNLRNEDFVCFTFPECVSYPMMFLSLWIWGMIIYWSNIQSRQEYMKSISEVQEGARRSPRRILGSERNSKLETEVSPQEKLFFKTVKSKQTTTIILWFSLSQRLTAPQIGPVGYRKPLHFL